MTLPSKRVSKTYNYTTLPSQSLSDQNFKQTPPKARLKKKFVLASGFRSWSHNDHLYRLAVRQYPSPQLSPVVAQNADRYRGSRFLPYTVNFHLDKSPSERSTCSSPRQKGSSGSRSPRTRKSSAVSLFEKNNHDTSRKGLTPGATTDDERIFTSQPKYATHNGYPFPVVNGDLPGFAQSEAHSPAWGSTQSFNQPRARTGPLPSPSILKHQEPVVKSPGRVETSAMGIEAIKAQEQQMRPGHHRSISFSLADWTIESAEQGNMGLRNAVRSAADAGTIGDVVWVGTLGMPTDALSEETKQSIAETLENEYDSLTVYTADNDFDGHYSHFCKTILWPVFHYQIPDNPKSKAYEEHSWSHYVKLNEAFAQRIAKSWRRGDAIWIHDYHLLLVPGMLRKLLPDAKIGFFLHIAFPSSEVFRCLAERTELLEGVLGADLVGFQTDEYCRHFLQTCSRILCVEARNDGVQLEDRFVNVGKFPIGIDPKSWDKRRQSPDVDHWIKLILERYQGKRLIVSRDKLDSVRGVRQKLLSYELFLNTHPEWREKVRSYFLESMSTLADNEIGGPHPGSILDE